MSILRIYNVYMKVHPSAREVDNLAIQVRLCQESDLATLNQTIISHGDWHRKRFETQQRDEAAYLVAWEGEVPVGHLYLTWGGSDQVEVQQHLQACPELSAIWVWPAEKRSLGIGKKLIAQAEELVRSRGYARVGLGVGVANERARELYERLGYKDWGYGINNNHYTNFKADGTPVEHVNPRHYLLKEL